MQDTYRDEEAGKGERFGYDAANQLRSAVYNAANVTTANPTNYDRSVSYTSDALNRLRMEDNGAVTNYTPNGLNQYTAVTGEQLDYNAKFSLRKTDGWTYGYDAADRVVSADAPGHAALFSYDGLNRCVQRTIDGVTTVFTYDGWKPIAEWNKNGNFRAWNIYGPGPDEILIRNEAGAPDLHYHADQYGTVKFLLNQNNVGIEKYTYDAFGAPTITDWAGNPRTDSAYGNRFMFTGREYLSTIGIYDYRNRMYSPLLGRFLQTDPTGFDAGDNNLYRYCGHNPVNRSDPSGLGFWGWLLSLNGNGTNSTSNSVTTYGAPPTGSNIPETQTYTGVPGSDLFNRVDNNVINGPTDRGSFALVSGGPFGDRPAFVPAIEIIRSGTLKVDDDGTGSRHGDPDHDNETAYTPNGRSLNADVDPYVAVPTSLVSPAGLVRLGDTAILIVNGISASGVVGDTGADPRYVEASVAMVHNAGVPTIDKLGGPVPNTRGGRDIDATMIILLTRYGFY